MSLSWNNKNIKEGHYCFISECIVPVQKYELVIVESTAALLCILSYIESAGRCVAL